MSAWWLRILAVMALGAVVLGAIGCGGDFTRPQVRAQHNAPGLQRVDLYVIPNSTRTPTSIADRQPLFVGLGYGETSQYYGVWAGDYEFVFTNWNTKQVRARDYMEVGWNRRITVRLELNAQQQPVIGYDIQTM